MSRVIEGQQRPKISIDALPTLKHKGSHREKMLIFQNPGAQAIKFSYPERSIRLDAKLTVMSLKPIKAIEPDGHSNDSCPDASCPKSACVTPQTGTQAKSCCIDCN